MTYLIKERENCNLSATKDTPKIAINHPVAVQLGRLLDFA